MGLGVNVLAQTTLNSMIFAGGRLHSVTTSETHSGTGLGVLPVVIVGVVAVVFTLPLIISFIQNNRRHARYVCHKPCQLYLRGSAYQATIKNESVGGMGLQFDRESPDVEVGDECLICLHGNECKMNYKVVRIDNSYIGVGSMLTN